jgi:hypothetical protein
MNGEVVKGLEEVNMDYIMLIFHRSLEIMR